MAKIFICRCEDVLVSEIEEAIDAGHTNVESLKRYTGFGTGVCQGKCCVAQVAKIVRETTGTESALVTPFTPRPPLSPIPMRLLAAKEDE